MCMCCALHQADCHLCGGTCSSMIHKYSRRQHIGVSTAVQLPLLSLPYTIVRQCVRVLARGTTILTNDHLIVLVNRFSASLLPPSHSCLQVPDIRTSHVESGTCCSFINSALQHEDPRRVVDGDHRDDRCAAGSRCGRCIATAVVGHGTGHHSRRSSWTRAPQGVPRGSTGCRTGYACAPVQ